MAGDRKLLVAEDEQDLIDLYRIMLGSSWEVLAACNGREAVVLYREHRPRVVLMDMKMPVMDGREAIREIRGIDPAARILAVTAYRFKESDLEVPVLRKGFTAAELEAAITALLD